MSDVTTATEGVEPDFDVIVIGAGVAGCVAAYLLAQAGRSVVLIERGDTPGAKNLSGGVLYSRVLEEVFPDFLTEAPIERTITRNYIQFLNGSSSIGIDYQDDRLANPVNAVTVLRATLDAWLAEKCEEAGVFLMAGVRVDAVLKENGRVVGVRAGEDELRAHVVVAADGVNSFIARDAGLRTKEPTNHLALGVKAIVSLPEETIRERFHLSGDEGAAYAVVGDCTMGVGGGGFMYTNKASLSIGVVLRLDDMTAKGYASSDVFDHFIAHPFVAPFLKDGEISEYASHLVAEGGLSMVGQIETDGMVVVGDAAGLTLNTGLTVRGMDLAAASGIAAATGIDQALTAGDTSKVGLAGYRTALFASFAGKDMETYAKAPAFLERERMYTRYGQLLGDILYGVFNHDLTPRRRLMSVARGELKRSPVRMRDLMSDGIAGVRAL
ncbi:electron transfer flavoprotein-quinone oxidoreductase [Sanguibacter gelidistatuariae]|uniref:Electron transfer flavoprotein-quinone oxidoreductase n=1 Tax=Sanguibacter gelidistatuariae TaxID=1814289 RepID=A0A1G6N1V8_9MICO|nr:FAD-dependent oxidoreductase [Sanguibacter gelidistatuariae]SDC61105.1 electron transfer flavoprotein-quinone oxidoreductase [Sanguibacter gelidistatuariae]